MVYLCVYSIGEESYSSGIRPSLTDTPTFCVDPIGTLLFRRGPTPIYPITTNKHPWDRYRNSHCVDGTTNFVHGFPFFCISLGLIHHRVPVLGVIYNPFLEQLYTGVRGAGSFLQTRVSPNDRGNTTPQRLPLEPASARPLPSLTGALIAVEWGSDRTREQVHYRTESYAHLLCAPPHGVMAHSLRSVGSTALDVALLAQGSIDVFWYVPRRCVVLIGVPLHFHSPCFVD